MNGPEYDKSQESRIQGHSDITMSAFIYVSMTLYNTHESA